MSHQYYDRGPAYGTQDYDMRPPGSRRPPQSGNHYPSDRSRAPPPLRPMRPGAPHTQQEYAPRPPQMPYAQQGGHGSAESLYDGSTYSGADDEVETWPLPARPFAQTGRPGSPGGSPHRSPRQPPPGPSGSNPRRPPQRPQRPDYQEQPYHQPRSAARIAPAERSYRQMPPQSTPSHHGSGQRTGDGYRSAQTTYPPSRPPPHQPPPPIPDYQMPQALQQTIYGSRFNARPPLGPPPSSRKGPASYYPQIAPVHPIVEETDSMRGSIRNASVAFDPAHSSYGSINAIPIGIPGYYVQDRGSARSFPFEQQGRPSVDHTYDEQPPIPPIQEYAHEREDESSRGEPSPEPAALIRQASLGKKTKPTLTTVKGSEWARKGSVERQAEARQPMPTTLAVEKETYTGRPSISSLSSDGGEHDKTIEAGGLPAVAGAALAVPAAARLAAKPRPSESEILRSGTGFIDESDSDEPPKPLTKKPSRELLAANLPKAQLNRSQPRSPLAPIDPLADEILRDAQRDAARASTYDPDDTLQVPGEGLSSRPSKRGPPPRLDIDTVRDAEARGSLTSLNDLIRRATKLASNLDRGRTASRLGMNFFVDGNASGEDKSYQSVSDNRRSGSMSDILSTFPPPSGVHRGAGSPGVSMSRWSSNLRHSHLPSDSDAGEAERSQRAKRGKRCCGMPLWVFLLLLFILFLLIAAAVLVPVVLLIILPDSSTETTPSNDNNSVTTSSKALSTCQAQLQCQNGGTNVLSSDESSCRCVCTNGFTGRTCETQSTAGCATLTSSSSSSTSDATIGSALPDLLSGAEARFNIDLNPEILLSLFSEADLSCTAENDLVTFTGTRSSDAIPEPKVETLDFARTAVLAVVEDSEDTAVGVQAQDALQNFFSGRSSQEVDATAIVQLGGGYSVNLAGRTLLLADGSTVGAGT